MKTRISGFELWYVEVFVRDWRHVSCETSCLIRVGKGKNDGRYEANSPFHVITKVPKILDTSTVLMISITEGVKEAH